MPDITLDELNVFQEKLGVETDEIKKEFSRRFPEQLPLLNNPNLGTSEERLYANAVYFGFKVGYLDQLYKRRMGSRGG